VSDKLHQIEENYYAFHCPGCGCGHAVTVNGKKNGCNASWGWNGSMDKPTFTPSINCNADAPKYHCHSFVKDGMIQFLGDCFHALASQTIEIPDWEE
jgi:hypothetical protein